jgi:lipopolysaccharide biosynthesis protein
MNAVEPPRQPSRRAIVLAHFDAGGGFAPHVQHALAAYREVAAHVVVASNSARSLPASLAKIIDTFLPRANVGYDFGAWRDGLATLRAGDFDEVLCVNDSVFGPLADIAPALDDPRVAAADLWGMVLSDQNARRDAARVPHLQSWFLGFRRPLLESDAFAEFWRGCEPCDTKLDVIERYEIGFTACMVEAGFQVAALYDATSSPPVSLREVWPHLALSSPRRSWRLLRKSRRPSHNPSELLWWRLWDAGIPYVKVGLFSKNHYGLDLRQVMAELRRRFEYDSGLIEAHLATA